MIALRCESTLATSGEITLGGVAGGRVGGIEPLLMTGMNCGVDTVRVSVSVVGSSFRGVSTIAEPSALPIDQGFLFERFVWFHHDRRWSRSFPLLAERSFLTDPVMAPQVN